MNTQTVQTLWSYFFPSIELNPDDKLYDAIQLFYEYFSSHTGRQTLLKYNGNNYLNAYKTNGLGQFYVFIHLPSVQQTIALPDFLDILLIRPKEVIACMGIASSIVFYNMAKASIPREISTIRTQTTVVEDAFSYADTTTDSLSPSPLPNVRPMYPQLIALQPFCLFSELKSEALGRLVSLLGYVTAVSHSHHMVIGAYFSCPKCNQEHLIPFEDGIYNPPTVCPTFK